MKVQSNRVVITEANSPVVSPNEGSKTNAVLVQSQLTGVNKVILSEGGAIPVRSEIVIEGKKQAKDISQVGMISASQADSVRHLQGLYAMTHIFCLELTIYLTRLEMQSILPH
jgi:hypothetical protein